MSNIVDLEKERRKKVSRYTRPIGIICIGLCGLIYVYGTTDPLLPTGAYLLGFTLGVIGIKMFSGPVE